MNNKTPITVYFSDNQSADIYKLTKAQLEELANNDDWETADKFKIDITQVGMNGYIPDYLEQLAVMFGFEVDTI